MGDSLRNDEIQGQIIHIYDGIEEADNALPRWWLATFFGACIFAVFYWMFFVSFPYGDMPGRAYTKARLAAMDKGGEVTEEDILMLVSDAPMVAAGKAEFIKNCVKCHGSRAEGKEGPNLTDGFWLYGGAPMDIFHTITTGTKKGMPDWGPKLGKGTVKQLTAYVITLRNTNQPGKAPQGTPWVEAPAANEAAAPAPEGAAPAPEGAAPEATPPSEEAAPEASAKAAASAEANAQALAPAPTEEL